MLATREFLKYFAQKNRKVDNTLEANHVVHEGKLKKGSIVRLKSYQANEVKGKKSIPLPLVEFLSLTYPGFSSF
jgi:replication factor A1